MIVEHYQGKWGFAKMLTGVQVEFLAKQKTLRA